jgi:hypothetical protein
MYSRIWKPLSRALALLVFVSAPVFLAAQDATKSTPKTSSDLSASRWDIFAGYSYLSPNSTVNNIVQSNGTLRNVDYTDAKVGLIASVAGYWNNHVGLQFEMAEHALTTDSSGNDNNDGFFTTSGGLI